MAIITSTPPTSLPPSGTASGDLSGTYPSPTVAKVNGIAVTGTPSTGYVPTATGASAATWQAAGGVVAIRGPYSIAFNTVGIMDPVDYGVELGSALAIGSYVEFWVTGTNWNQAADLSLGIGSSADAQYVLTDRALHVTLAATYAEQDYLSGVAPVVYPGRYRVKTAGSKLVAAVYPDAAAPTAGTAEIVVFVYTP